MKRAIGRFLLGLVFIPIALVVNVLDLLFWPFRLIHRYGSYVYDNVIGPTIEDFRR